MRRRVERMGENENGTEEWPDADEAAPTPSLDRPARHTFIVRLIPKFTDRPESQPRWHGEMEHICEGQKVVRHRFKSIDEMLTALVTTVYLVLHPDDSATMAITNIGEQKWDKSR